MRAEFLRTWGPGFEQEGAGGGGGGRTGGAAQCVRGNSKSFKGIQLTVLELSRRRQLTACTQD